MKTPNDPNVVEPSQDAARGPSSANGYTHAIVLLDTLTIKTLKTCGDMMNVVADKGREKCVILKWHEGANQWVAPKVVAWV